MLYTKWFEADIDYITLEQAHTRISVADNSEL